MTAGVKVAKGSTKHSPPIRRVTVADRRRSKLITCRLSVKGTGAYFACRPMSGLVLFLGQRTEIDRYGCCVSFSAQLS